MRRIMALVGLNLMFPCLKAIVHFNLNNLIVRDTLDSSKKIRGRQEI